jgi:hypothetical protein
MKDLIKKKLVEFHATCEVDKWGQKGTLSVYEVFGQDHKEVADYVHENKGVLYLSSYGGRFGTWLGISKTIDADIKLECDKAFNDNPNRKRAMTN